MHRVKSQAPVRQTANRPTNSSSPRRNLLIVFIQTQSSFKAQVIDTEKRLNILFDHLNNDDLLKPETIQNVLQLAGAIQARDYATAQAIHLDVLTNKTDECGQWMVCWHRH
jgi:hypothetical protein